MASPWTDESAILRDLSFAQGRWVPGGIDSAVAGTKPPTNNITEETEEEYYQHWTLDSGGTGDFGAGPDLLHIKTMLELMQDDNPIEDNLSGPIEIRKLKLPVANSVPKTNNVTNKHKPNNINKPNNMNNKSNNNKPRRARNVAIASILALAPSQEPLKLAKPEDFIKPSKEDELIEERRIDSVNKVTNWLQSQDITSMFKKKSSVNSVKEEQRSKDDSQSAKQSPVHSEDSAKSPTGQYTPSSWAHEYYRKAVARSRVSSIVQEDVWGRAERAMREIDAKKEELRKQAAEAELAAEMAKQCEALGATELADIDNVAEPDTALTLSSGTTDETEGIAKILLPKSRHELYPGTCVVCAALAPGPDKPGVVTACPDVKDGDLLSSESDSSFVI